MLGLPSRQALAAAAANVWDMTLRGGVADLAGARLNRQSGEPGTDVSIVLRTPTSLRGDTYIREIDHQAAVGSYFSDLTWSDEHGMYVYERAEPVPPDEIWLSEDEVRTARGE